MRSWKSTGPDITAVEYKYDGLRLQCHVTKDSVRLFSRRLEELTDQFPDVQQHLKDALRGETCIVEGEVLAVDLETGALRSFQEISRRRGRKTGLGEDARKEAAFGVGATAATMMDEIPVALFLFDCMADAHDAMADGYLARRARLDKLFAWNDRVQLATMQECTDAAGVEAFFQQAVQEGAEGIMCKHPAGALTRRATAAFDWIKYKTDYTEDLVDTMDLVPIGAFWGRGRRAGWYGALLMACRDEDTGRFQSVCKLGTGFDDATAHRPQGPLRSPAGAAIGRGERHAAPTSGSAPRWSWRCRQRRSRSAPCTRRRGGRHRAESGLAARFPRLHALARGQVTRTGPRRWPSSRRCTASRARSSVNRKRPATSPD